MSGIASSLALLRLLLLPLMLALAGPALAQARAQLFVAPQDDDRGPLLQAGQPLFSTGSAAPTGGSPSLFTGSTGGRSLLSRARLTPDLAPGPLAGKAERIRHIIARAEAGPAGYDAVQYGARIKPRRPPTQLRLSEIFAWIDRTPGQPHAIGRYQFIPATLRRLVEALNLPAETRFSPRVQDRLADLLLHEAGLGALQRGEITRTAFMNNLARIWAGLPNSSGRSHYHGYAGNRATMTWAAFQREMAPIFPG
ncbi:hypothetical protein [Salipiger mucosus]|uniref:Lysozyme n=1 Tax=Salipiger mucosus DSM 16094 TaxID=1123237 RepID=S9R4M5_9RHOB|nr:hypothetical protein [Salipiger mucosus]EPX86877.1 hypothetical protein Salmuc_01528 [Salipiger mucosus DSM 16094]